MRRTLMLARIDLLTGTNPVMTFTCKSARAAFDLRDALAVSPGAMIAS